MVMEFPFDTHFPAYLASYISWIIRWVQSPAHHLDKHTAFWRVSQKGGKYSWFPPIIPNMSFLFIRLYIPLFQMREREAFYCQGWIISPHVTGIKSYSIIYPHHNTTEYLKGSLSHPFQYTENLSVVCLRWFGYVLEYFYGCFMPFNNNTVCSIQKENDVCPFLSFSFQAHQLLFSCRSEFNGNQNATSTQS